MKMSQHTQGPWETDNSWSLHGEARPDMMDYRCNVDVPAPFTENEYGGFEHVETQTGAIAFGRTPEEAQANARLIAAAPEFLETLRELQPVLLADHGCKGGLSEATRKRAYAIVSEAIAKVLA